MWLDRGRMVMRDDGDLYNCRGGERRRALGYVSPAMNGLNPAMTGSCSTSNDDVQSNAHLTHSNSSHMCWYSRLFIDTDKGGEFNMTRLTWHRYQYRRRTGR